MNSLLPLVETVGIASLSLAAGYLLNTVTHPSVMAMGRKLKWDIDFQNGLSYQKYTQTLLANNQTVASLQHNLMNRHLYRFLHNFGLHSIYEKVIRIWLMFSPSTAKKHDIALNSRLNAILTDMWMIAAQEEVAYRGVLQGLLTRYVCSSLPAACLTTTAFATMHLLNDLLPRVVKAQFFNTLALGTVCAVVSSRFGLISSIFVHMGFNLWAWQRDYDKSCQESISVMRTGHFARVVYYEITDLQVLLSLLKKTISEVCLLPNLTLLRRAGQYALYKFT